MLMVKSMVVAASVAVLVGSTNTQSQPNDASSAPAHPVSVNHQPAAAVSPNGTGTHPAVQDPPPPELVHTCFPINADGVRIHATFDLSSPVLGLAYKGDLFQVPNFPGGGVVQGTDLRTGAHGWISDDFVDLHYLHC